MPLPAPSSTPPPRPSSIAAPPPPPSPPPARSSNGWGPPTTPPGLILRSAAPAFHPGRAPHETLPLAAGIGALLVLVASLLGSKFALDALVGFEWPVVIYVALLGVIGYGPSLVWWWYSMARWGNAQGLRGRLHAAGVRPKWRDLAWGPLIWLCTILVQAAITAIVLVLDVPIASNTDGVDELTSDRTYTIAIVITAVVAAPLVEELVFRGIVMRSLLSKMPAVPAIALQGVLFGVAHVDPVRGVGNVGLAIVLSVVGIAFGAAAFWLRRVGPTIVAHAIFNGFVMFLLLSGVRDRLLEDNPDPFDLEGRSAAALIVEEVAVVDEANVSEPHSSRDPHRSH
ncbi:MAG: lysostaphin resistance A-like protein [Ilumatobacter sp.]